MRSPFYKFAGYFRFAGVAFLLPRKAFEAFTSFLIVSFDKRFTSFLSEILIFVGIAQDNPN